MKTISSILLALSFLFLISCESKTKKENKVLKEQLALLEQENLAYKETSKKLQANVKDYKAFLKEINNNLKEIDLSSSEIGLLNNEGEKDEDIQEGIQTRLKRVSELIRNSKMRIISLDSKLNELRSTTNVQSEEILQLEMELNQAAADLIEKERSIIELNTTQEQLEILTADLQAILNRAYFYEGTAKKLKEKGIVENEGGFIGIGKVKILNANTADSVFTRIEKDATDSIHIRNFKVKLITNHPESSYAIEKRKGGSAIIIKDKKAFWNQGNYLVVQKD